MLSILVDNQSLDLSADFSVSLNLKSPIFNDVGDYSFPFKVPATSKNKVILGWKNRIASSNSIYQTYDGRIQWNGMELYAGQIKIKVAGDKTFEGTLYIDKGNFNYEIKDLLLHRIDFGSKTFDTDQEAINYFNYSLTHFYPEMDFAMPEINNVDYYDPQTTNVDLMSYNHIFTDGWLRKMSTDGTSKNILTPFLYLRFVLNKLAETFGYRLEDNFFSSSFELSRLVIYHSVNLNDIIFGLQQIYYCRFLPQIKVSEFIAGLEKWFNCSFHTDYNQKVIRIVSNKEVLLHSEVIDFSKNIISISQEIPDPIEGFQFLSGPDSGDKVYQERLEQEKGIIEMVKGAVQSFSDIPAYPFTMLGDIYYVVDSNAWWQLGIVNWMVQWVQLTAAPTLIDKFFYKWGSDANKFETIFSTLSDQYMVVNCGNLGADYQKITPRLFWVNLTGNPARLRGFASGSNFTLRYTGGNGLFNLYWKDWANWIMNDRKCVKIEKQMDFTQLKNLDFTKRYSIDGINYLISEVAVTLNISSIKSTQLKCFTAT
ncbi:MAG: hypothetical protein WCL00_00840 [Bacteroidota bacterium]